jgi:hypothetical protein
MWTILRHAASSILLFATAALAQSPAGTVAALQGRAEAQGAGQSAWRPLALRSDVFVGERLRIGDASRLKLLMRDDSVVRLGPRAELTIDEQLVRAEGGTSRLGALVGAVRAVVTERYGTPGASFEVKTPTVVAGVRGTGFVVLVDADGTRTRVVGLYDVTRVRSVADARGRREVRIGPGQLTEIVAGADPTPPRTLSSDEKAALVEPTEIVPTPAGDESGAAPPSGTPAEGSGDVGDPATPGPPGGLPTQRPDAVIDQPLDRLPGPRQPPPPPPRR